VILGPTSNSSGNFLQEFADGSETPHLARLSTLKPDPLTVDVVFAIKTGAVPLYAGLRANQCG
jgi:hypothetical protein